MALLQPAILPGQAPAPTPAHPLATMAPAQIQTLSSASQQRILQINGIKREAISRVERIANNPVPKIPIGRGMVFFSYPEGWFHEGAMTPDFANVDVRSTQTNPYQGLGYVTSPLNPGYVFQADQLSFNPNIKIFYRDRTVPKKHLTEQELLEINRLYRIIAQCNVETKKVLTQESARNFLANQKNEKPEPEPPAAPVPSSSASSGGIPPEVGYPLAALLGGILLIGLFRRLFK